MKKIFSIRIFTIILVSIFMSMGTPLKAQTEPSPSKKIFVDSNLFYDCRLLCLLATEWPIKLKNEGMTNRIETEIRPVNPYPYAEFSVEKYLTNKDTFYLTEMFYYSLSSIDSVIYCSITAEGQILGGGIRHKKDGRFMSKPIDNVSVHKMLILAINLYIDGRQNKKGR